MAGPGMHQTQNLSLQQVLAPQLQQSLLILQAPLLELRNLVQQEMETNPVLEELPDAPNPDAPAESETPPADDNFKEEFDRLAKLDEEWRDYMALNTGIPQEDFEHMLTLIQSFHPPGVGAGDLRECLLIQLKREGRQNSLEYKIVADHMQDFGKRRFPEIARRIGISVEQVQKCANNIAQLDPRPGAIFAEAPQNYVLPDVTVEKINGTYQVILNGEQIPHLRISNTYKDIMAQDRNGSEVKDYIRDKIRSGKFLIKSIHQRQQTISNIAHEIVKRQREFFDKGSAFLKPMTMVQIADAVGVHETTVSR